MGAADAGAVNVNDGAGGWVGGVATSSALLSSLPLLQPPLLSWVGVTTVIATAAAPAAAVVTGVGGAGPESKSGAGARPATRLSSSNSV